MRDSAVYDRALNDFLNAFADHDEQWAGALHRQVAARLAELAQPAHGEACLEVGGGDGIVATTLCDAVGPGGVVVSLDSAARTAAPARSRGAANLHLMRMTGDDVIFRDGTFDVVVLSRSIAYASDAAAVIGEAVRTLKPGGRLVLFCRRRGLATRAEAGFLAELEAFVRDQPVSVPERFLRYPRLADRADLEPALRKAGLEQVSFGDVVTGGRAPDLAAFNTEMMRCWPAARIVLEALAGSRRRGFEARVEAMMRGLGEDAYRFHHPYLLARGIRAGAGARAQPA